MLRVRRSREMQYSSVSGTIAPLNVRFSMYILGIDTSTMTGSIAIITEDRLVTEYTVNTKTTHAERLLPTIQAMIQASRLTLDQIDGIAVASGPGSFTGLRIGVTTAKSIAYSIRKPIVGVPSLDALASQYLYTSQLLCPIFDARKKEVYTAFYRNEDAHVHRLSQYAVIAPEHFLTDLQEPVLFLGDGVATYRKQIVSMLGERALFADAAHLLPRGSLVAKLGYERLITGDDDDCLSLTPFYIRKSDAEIHWEKGTRSQTSTASV